MVTGCAGARATVGADEIDCEKDRQILPIGFHAELGGVSPRGNIRGVQTDAAAGLRDQRAQDRLVEPPVSASHGGALRNASRSAPPRTAPRERTGPDVKAD